MLKIYKIIDNTNGNIYIGKTEQTLKLRLIQHKSHKNFSSKEIIKNGDYKIELIEETDDDTRERYYIENTTCINLNIPGRTQKEYYEDNKQYHKEYYYRRYQHNKKEIKKHQNEYYSNNKDKKKYYYEFRCSWGGDPRKNNNLLKIDPNLFF